MTSGGGCYMEGCDTDPRWTWHDGMWPGGQYCDDHIRDKLDSESDSGYPSYRDPITTLDNVSRLPSGVAIIPAGAQPIDASFPTIRSIEAFDRYVDGNGDDE